MQNGSSLHALTSQWRGLLMWRGGRMCWAAAEPLAFTACLSRHTYNTKSTSVNAQNSVADRPTGTLPPCSGCLLRFTKCLTSDYSRLQVCLGYATGFWNYFTGTFNGKFGTNWSTGHYGFNHSQAHIFTEHGLIGYIINTGLAKKVKASNFRPCLRQMTDFQSFFSAEDLQ